MHHRQLSGIFVVAAKRTAFGAYGGTLKNHSATDLQTITNIAALKAGNVNPENVDCVVVGNVMQVRTKLCIISLNDQDLIQRL